MSKKSRKTDRRQLDIFDYIRRMNTRVAPSTEGSLNVRDRLRITVNRAIKDCASSRWEIAGEMSHLLGMEISKYMLDAWTAESKEGHRMPAEYLPAFCKACSCREPLQILNEAADIFALPGPDALRAEIQRFAEKERSARAEKRKRELFLTEMEKVKGRKA